MSSIDRNLPHCVATTDGVFMHGYNDNQIAEDSAKEMNERAAQLGIKTRYKAGKTEEICPVPVAAAEEVPAEA